MQIEYFCHWFQVLSHSEHVRLSVVAFKVIACSKSQTALLLLHSSEKTTFSKLDSRSSWAKLTQLLGSLHLILMFNRWHFIVIVSRSQSAVGETDTKANMFHICWRTHSSILYIYSNAKGDADVIHCCESNYLRMKRKQAIEKHFFYFQLIMNQQALSAISKEGWMAASAFGFGSQ